MVPMSSVPASPPAPVAQQAAPAAPPPPAKTPLEDWVDLSYIPVPVKAVKHIEDPEEAMGLKAPPLQRPVIMIHGLAQHADTWVNMKNFFTGNPANRFGGVYHVDREAAFLQALQNDPGANVFALDLSNNLASPQGLGAEVRQAVTAVMKATGAREVDLVTHSMGSLVAREALRQGENRVKNLVMVSPPNHGAMEATLATLLDDARVYGHYPAGRMGAMDALRLEYGPLGDVRNEYLHELNEDWKNHSATVKGSVVTGVGLPTPDISVTGTETGDGMVSVYQAPLEGADFYVIHPNKLPPDHEHFRDFQNVRYNHLQVVSEPEVYRQVAELLTGAPTPAPPPPAPPVTPGDLARLQARSRAARATLADAVARRRLADDWQRGGLWTMSAGAGLTAGALAAAAASPLAGFVLGAAGVLAMGAGGALAWRNARLAREASDDAVAAARDCLDVTDDTVHRLLRGPVAPAPPASAP